MSLEQAITDHASALRELAAAIRATISGAPQITVADAGAAVSTAVETPAPSAARAAIHQALEAAKADANAKKAAATASSPAASAAPSTSGQGADSEPAPSYDDVKAKVVALSKEKGREPAVQLLQRYGVAKAPELAPEQYAEFIKDVDAILAGTYNPETAAA